MFHTDITLVLTLIAMATGAFLVLSAKIRQEVPKICTFIGYIVIILSAAIFVMSGYDVVNNYPIKQKMISNMKQQINRPRMPMMPPNIKQQTKPKTPVAPKTKQ